MHPETHFTDEKAGRLRASTYRRLRRHWQFGNDLLLFEVDNHIRYGVHVYGREREPSFLQATSLYHPDTVERSLNHDSQGPEPGLKDPDGNWDLRPHANRIQRVDNTTLATWHAVLESGKVPITQSRMVYTVNRSTAAVLDKLAGARRVGELSLAFSAGWHEKADRAKGFFDAEWGVPESWDQVILQGPHLYVATPMYKTPNPTMISNKDWTATDFEALAPDAVPATAYKPRGDRNRYDTGYTHWDLVGSGGRVSARSCYRLAWRNMASNTGERTLTPALIPPGAAHIHTVYDFGAPGMHADRLVLAAASLSSLLSDFAVRSVPKSSISWETANRLALPDARVAPHLLLRALRLNCLSDAYSDLWRLCYGEGFLGDSWTTGGVERVNRPDLENVGAEWTPDTPLRVAADRRQAQVEIDALVALGLSISADELCTIYRTQFPVLYGYDRTTYLYDAMGRVVPSAVLAAWRAKGDRLDSNELSARHPGSGVIYEYRLPFRPLDREQDMRDAYSAFEARLASLISNSL